MIKSSRSRPAPLETALPETGIGQQIQRFSTRTRPPGDRFEYWRSLHPRVVIETPDPATAASFRGEMLLHVSADGIAFSHYTCDAVTARFGQTGADSIMVAAHWEGATRVRVGSGETILVTPDSGIYIVDAAKPITVATQGHSLGYISMPRAHVIAALGNDLSFLEPGFLSLGRDGLAGFMVEHLRRMHQVGPDLSPLEVSGVMQAAASMALACLRSIYGSGPALERSVDALHEAALRHIARYGSDESLTATTIAAAIGCSRAHLYRVFAAHGETIAASLRQARLNRARQLLTAHPPASVDQVALACGYGDADSLTRAFRRQFGMTPAQWRDRRN